MVGNLWEWTTGQITTAIGHDNGRDGLWYGATLPSTQTNISAFRMDLLRAYPSYSSLSVISHNGNFYWYSSSLRGSVRGGASYNGGGSGRWGLYAGYLPSGTSSDPSPRCGL